VYCTPLANNNIVFIRPVPLFSNQLLAKSYQNTPYKTLPPANEATTTIDDVAVPHHQIPYLAGPDVDDDVDSKSLLTNTVILELLNHKALPEFP
jgi:hypothetical protein